ncbi:histone-binding protein N1/N2-like [Lingula anatina]|uniref:Histone-binding protein N1/N2-like n=1 Tax=Lingula anatina TaxID=7574 RepID=A0A1S3JBH8_LINAN|nr:histone-binding protein N1/N2-like [Lingula anatina]|eukprot:XP_013407239.1 histone-binding protein N1/N2-like [Lingula anatina]
MTDVAASSSAVPEIPNQDPTDMLAKGRRDLLCGEIPAAVNCLQEACRLLAEKHGETSNECGDAYFYYGKALLDLARMENGVLGNALQGVPEEDEEEEEKEKEANTDENFGKPEEIDSEEKEKIATGVKEAMALLDVEKEQAEKKTDGTVEEKQKNDDTSKEVKDTEDVEMNSTDDNKEGIAEEKGKGITEEKKEDTTEENKEATAEEKKDGPAEEKKDGTTEGEKSAEEEKKEDALAAEEQSDKENEEPVKKEKKEEEKESGQVEKEKDTETITQEEKSADKETEEEMETDKADSNEGEEQVEEEGEDEEEGDVEDGAEENKDEEDPDDIPNLQLSWEMLELAKVIYEKQESKEMKLKAAQAHLALGEVALETEQYESAIEDFTKCLNIQKENLDPMDRLIAETQYQLGLAFSFNKQFDESLKHYKDAKQVLENRIAMLTKKVEEAEAQDKGKAIPTGDDPIVAARKELGDLKEIIPDIETKMEDVLEERRNLDMIKDMAKAATGFEKPAFDAPSNAEPAQSIAVKKATEISVRKKRKPDEEEAGGDAENKKPKVNGHAINGNAEEKIADSTTSENAAKPTETAV